MWKQSDGGRVAMKTEWRGETLATEVAANADVPGDGEGHGAAAARAENVAEIHV